MKITEVRYERKFLIAEFETEGLCALATLDPGETPEAAMEALRKFVVSQSFAARKKAKALAAQNSSVNSSADIDKRLSQATANAKNSKQKTPSGPA